MKLARLPILPAVTVLLAMGAGCNDFGYLWPSHTSIETDVTHMEDPIFPDERRQGVTGLQKKDELYNDAYRARLREMAGKDEAPSVRAQALRALNQSRDTAAVPLFVKGLADPAPAVRLEAAKAIRHCPAESAVAPLTKLAEDKDEVHEVRVWSATALGNYPTLAVARALVPLLDDRDFGVSYASRAALRNLTGKDYHYDESLWLSYLTTVPKPFRTLPAPLGQ